MLDTFLKLITNSKQSYGKNLLRLQTIYPSTKDNTFTLSNNHSALINHLSLDGIQPSDCYFKKGDTFVGFNTIADKHHVLVFPMSVMSSKKQWEPIIVFAKTHQLNVGVLELTTNTYCKDMANNTHRAIIINPGILKAGRPLFKP